MQWQQRRHNVLCTREEFYKAPRDHVMLSGRFTSKEKVDYLRAVEKELQAMNIKTFLVDTKRDFGPPTMRGLSGARVMVAFCTSAYGEENNRHL
ncbi:unnamed protein product [Symbiodinium microadriaticum]|nr:unnamed protein product [Symbiodinium sp. KB8]CAE7344132.1 unnamed protein product [Symbiodinium microadriaticum]